MGWYSQGQASLMQIRNSRDVVTPSRLPSLHINSAVGCLALTICLFVNMAQIGSISIWLNLVEIGSIWVGLRRQQLLEGDSQKLIRPKAVLHDAQRLCEVQEFIPEEFSATDK